MASAEGATWLRGQSAPLRGALLGLLLERPGHGFDLATRLDARLGEAWRIEKQDVYRLLGQLEKSGHARTDEQRRRGRNGTQTYWFPTESSGKALTLWMETHLPMAPVRIGVQAKLAVARDQDVPQLLSALQRYELECLELLRSMPAPPVNPTLSWKQLFIDCTRDAVDGQLHHEIEWAQRTRGRIRDRVEARA